MNWISAYLKRPHAVTALILLGVAFGFIGFKTLPLNLFPDTNYPQISILLIWPGASAEDMADKISRQVEKQGRGVTRQRGQVFILDNSASKTLSSLLKI